MNFRCCPKKKSYMINIHEREDVKIDRKNHVKTNAALELEEPCWIQFKVDDLRKMLIEANMSLSRQEVLCQKGHVKNNTIEFHADDDPYFQKLVEDHALQGCLSMR